MKTQPIYMGPLEPLLADPMITKISFTKQAIRPKYGTVTHTNVLTFASEQEHAQFILNILEMDGAIRCVDPTPTQHVLDNGSRIYVEHDQLAMTLHQQD